MACGAALLGGASPSTAAHGPTGSAPARATGALGALPAAEPMNLRDEITDEAGVLEDPEGLQEEIDRLQQEHGVQVFAVFVDSFDGSSDQWGRDTFDASGMGSDDVLLAVAVEDRSYTTYGGTGTLSQADGATLRREYIEPALAQEDWDGAVSGTVEGITDVAEGRAGEGAGSSGAGGSNGSSGLGGGSWMLWLLGLPVLGGALAMLRGLGRRPARATGSPAPAPGGAPVPTADLQNQASELLVRVDDAVRSSDEEVRYSRAQFGAQATGEFEQAVKEARGRASEAFSLKQQLDDAVRGGRADEGGVRASLTRINALAQEALDILDAQSEKFDRLRDLESRAPEVLAGIDQRAGEVEARLPGAREQLRALEVSFAPTALATVSGNIEQAERLITSARQSGLNGQAALEKQDKRTAVTAARTGEDALGQASDLLDQVDDARATLENASQELARAIGSISADIADAHRLAPSDGALQPLVARAEQAIAQGEASRNGGDPLAALAELEAAEAAIDAALEPARSADEHRQKVTGTVSQRLARLRAAHASVDEFIRTRRGSVGGRARTEISEAGRLLDEAQHRLGEDPAGAAALLDQAEPLIESARREAENDMTQGPFGPGGGYGGRQVGGIDMGSLILGGILSGGFGGGGGGGFGGGGFGGGLGGGGFSGGGRF